MRSLTCVIVQAAVFGAFAQALPSRMPACPASSVCLLNVKTSDSAGRTIMASIGPVGGGAGGSAAGDGSDASGANMAFLKNTPVEINEAEVPVRITEYRLLPDSGGPGQYRGGMGVVMAFKVFAPNSLVTARNRDRTIFGSWGAHGGQSGRTSAFIRNPGPDQELLGNTDLVACKPGDIIRLEGNGGGGFGFAFKRAVADVVRDVRRGNVSVDAARDVYGVVMADGQVDESATQARRAAMAADAPQTPSFGYGANREAHEQKWTRERYALLTEQLQSIPVGWRFFVKHQMFDRLDALLAQGKVEPGVAVVKAIFDELMAQYPALVPQGQKNVESDVSAAVA